MSKPREIGDGLAVLQLQKWHWLPFQLEISEFSEAFISPTRQLLLLLSHQFEAMLLSLTPGVSLVENISFSVSLCYPSCY